MLLCPLQLSWAWTKPTSVVLCLLFAGFQVSAGDDKVTNATLKASMINSHNATIHFNKVAFTSFYGCLCKTETLRCVVNLMYAGTPSLNYTAKSAQTIMKTATDQTNYSKKYVCVVPQFQELLSQPSARFMTCTRLNELCRTRNKDHTYWSIRLNNSCSTDLIWIRQDISFYTEPDDVIEKEESECQDGCDQTCLSEIAFQKIVTPAPAEMTTEITLKAGANDDTSTNPVGVIVGVVFAVLIIVALIITGVLVWKRRSRTLNSSKAVTPRGQESLSAANEPSPQAFSSNHAESQLISGHKQNTHNGLGNDSVISTYATIKYHDNDNAENGISIYNDISATDTDNEDGFSGDVSISTGNNNNFANCYRNNDRDTSQYTYIDGTDLHKNQYSRLREETKIFAHPYNDLLNPKEDPQRRSPIPTSGTSSEQTSSYSLAQPIIDGASGGDNRPSEVIDIAHPVYKPNNDHSVKGIVELAEGKSTNDYNYPSDEEMPKRKEQMYFELEKEEEAERAETNTAGVENDRPYFELEQVDDSDTYCGSGYPNHGFESNQ